MAPAIAAFALAFMAGFILRRLGSKKRLAPWERRVLRPAGLVLMASSLTVAAALFGWAALMGM